MSFRNSNPAPAVAILWDEVVLDGDAFHVLEVMCRELAVSVVTCAMDKPVGQAIDKCERMPAL